MSSGDSYRSNRAIGRVRRMLDSVTQSRSSRKARLNSGKLSMTTGLPTFLPLRSDEWLSTNTDNYRSNAGDIHAHHAVANDFTEIKLLVNFPVVGLFNKSCDFGVLRAPWYSREAGALEDVVQVVARPNRPRTPFLPSAAIN